MIHLSFVFYCYCTKKTHSARKLPIHRMTKHATTLAAPDHRGM